MLLLKKNNDNTFDKRLVSMHIVAKNAVTSKETDRLLRIKLCYFFKCLIQHFMKCIMFHSNQLFQEHGDKLGL